MSEPLGRLAQVDVHQPQVYGHAGDDHDIVTIELVQSGSTPVTSTPLVSPPNGGHEMVVDKRPADDPIHEIEPSVQEELIRHPGKWVVMTRSRIIAIRDTAEEAYAAARAAGVALPILYQVPDTRATYSYF